MAEITVNGTTLDPYITKWKHKPYTHSTTTTLEWPTQQCLEAKLWKIWKAAIITLVATDKQTFWKPVTEQWKPQSQHTRQWKYQYHHPEKITNKTDVYSYPPSPTKTQYKSTEQTNSIHKQGIPIQLETTAHLLTTTGNIAKYEDIPHKPQREEQNTGYKT